MSSAQPDPIDSSKEETLPTLQAAKAFHPGWAETVHYEMASAPDHDKDQAALSDQRTHTMPQNVLDATQINGTLMTKSLGEQPLSGASSLNDNIGTRVIARDPSAAIPGQGSADYTMMAELGRGGMGKVHLARQSSLRRMVAIKTIRADRRGLKADAAFLDEAWVTGALEHPNIVPIYDAAFDQGGAPFYTMPRINGRVWSDVIKDLSLQENMEVLIRVGDAIAYAHDQGVLHRDLKPSNIMLGEYGEVLVLDWGLAVALTPDAQAQALSSASALAGTPSYVPPETATGQVHLIGVPSDIYLLGGILCEIVTGCPPHHAETVRESLGLSVAGNIPNLSCDATLAAIITRCLALVPDDRYQKVKDLQLDLRQWAANRRSFELCAEARKILDGASSSRTSDLYAPFTQAIANYQLAIDEWADNAVAHEGLIEARFAYAQRAFDGGDLALAETQIQPLRGESDATAHQVNQLEQQIRSLRQRRERRRQQFRIMVYSIIILTVGIIGSLSLGYVLVDGARSRLAVALDREETANEELQATNAELDQVNTQLQVENLASRLQLISNDIDQPVHAFDALQAIDPGGKHARSWPWKRLRHLATDGFQRFGGPGEQHILSSSVSPDGTHIAALRSDGHLWLIPTKNPSLSFPLKSLPFGAYFTRWSPTGRFLVVYGYNKKGAVLDRSGNIIKRFQGRMANERLWGVRFLGRNDRQALIINEGIVSLYSFKDQKTLFEIADKPLSWLYLPPYRGHALAIDLDHKVYRCNLRDGTMEDMGVSVLPQFIERYIWENEPAHIDNTVRHVPRVRFMNNGKEAILLGEGRSLWHLSMAEGKTTQLSGSEGLEKIELHKFNRLELQVDELPEGSRVRVFSAVQPGMLWVFDKKQKLILAERHPAMIGGTHTGIDASIMGLTNIVRNFTLLDGLVPKPLDDYTFPSFSGYYYRPTLRPNESLVMSESGLLHFFQADQSRSNKLSLLTDVDLTAGAPVFQWDIIPAAKQGFRQRGRGQLAINSQDGFLSLFSLDRLASTASQNHGRERRIVQYTITAPPHGPYVLSGSSSLQNLSLLSEPKQRIRLLKTFGDRFQIRDSVTDPQHRYVAVNDITGNAQVFSVQGDGVESLFDSVDTQKVVISMALSEDGLAAFVRIPENGMVTHNINLNVQRSTYLSEASRVGLSEIEIWNIAEQTLINTISVPRYNWYITWDDANKTLITVDLHGVIRRIDPTSGAITAIHDTGMEAVHAVVAYPEKRRLVCAGLGEQSLVISFDFETLGSASIRAGQVNRLAFSPDGELVAELLDQGDLRIWSVSNGVELYRENLRLDVSDVDNSLVSPQLIWDHTTGDIMVYVKEWMLWRLRVSDPSKDAPLPPTDPSIQSLRNLIPLAQSLLRQNLMEQAIHQLYSTSPQEFARTLHLLAGVATNVISYKERMALLEQMDPEPLDTQDLLHFKLAYAHSLVGDYMKPGSIRDGLEQEVYIKALDYLRDIAPHLDGGNDAVNASQEWQALWYRLRIVIPSLIRQTKAAIKQP